MKSFFDDGTHSEITSRINNLTANTQANWGKMNVGQMLHHCQMPLNVILEHEDYNLKPNWLVKTFFKKAMYSDKPWRKNMPTMSQFKVNSARAFESEKLALLQLTDQLHAKRDQDVWQPHPSFGELTKDQWGKMQYKHLDHHLQQFGV